MPKIALHNRSNGVKSLSVFIRYRYSTLIDNMVGFCSAYAGCDDDYVDILPMHPPLTIRARLRRRATPLRRGRDARLRAAG